MNKRDAPFLAANIFSEKGQPASEFLPNTQPSKLFEAAEGIKIGVVGLSTKVTPQTATGFTDQLFPKYEFREYLPFVVEESRKLREQGANCIILLGHLGARCPSDLKHQNRTRKLEQHGCDEDELTKLIDELPEGTIDAVVAGHIHEIAHHYHRNIPVVCSKNAGTYFNVLYLKFEKHSHKLRQTFIEGPIPICERLFENTGSCDYLFPEQLKNAGKLVDWRFHGEPVIPSRRLDLEFDKWHTALEPFLTKLADNYVYLTRIRHQESELTNLFVDLIFDAAYSNDAVKVKPDFGLINTGTLRTTWLPGELVIKDIYAMIPFDNLLVTFKILGANL
jgi:5'-nucleotidase